MNRSLDDKICISEDVKKDILLKIENIEHGYRMIDNIFKCMPMYWKGEAADSIQDIYIELREEIDIHIKHLDMIKKQLMIDKRGVDNINIKKLPNIF